MAFKLAEAFVELNLRDSKLVAGLARVNRAVDDTHQRLSSLVRLNAATAGLSALPLNETPVDVSTPSADTRGSGLQISGPNRFQFVGNSVDAPNPDSSALAELKNVGRMFAELADPLRDLSSSLGKLPPDDGSGANLVSTPSTTRPLEARTESFSVPSALLDELSQTAASRNFAERADRQIQRQLEALQRLNENVSRILQIQETRQAAATAVFSPPA